MLDVVLKENVTLMRKSMFLQDRTQVIETIITLLEIFSKNIHNLDNQTQMVYSEMLRRLDKMFMSGDLLAVSDILKFEIVPLFLGREEI